MKTIKGDVPQSFKIFSPWTMSICGEMENALAMRSIPIRITVKPKMKKKGVKNAKENEAKN